MYKVISFDLDKTLVKNTYPDKVWLEGLPRIYSIEKKIDFEKAKEYIYYQYDEIGGYRVEWYDLDYWFKKFNLKSSWKDLLNYYRYEIVAYSEVEEVLKYLKKKFDLVIISNAKKEFIDIELDQTGFTKYFNRIYSSTSDYHEVKKVSIFYQNICKDLKVTPKEMIHIWGIILYLIMKYLKWLV